MFIKRFFQNMYTKLNQKVTGKLFGYYIKKERDNGNVVDLQNVIGMSLKKKKQNPRNIANVFDVDTENIPKIDVDASLWTG